VSAIPAEENVNQFVSLLDRCLSHDAFTQRQRRRIASWKEQAHRIWSALPSAPGRNSSNGVNSSSGGPGLPKMTNSDSTSSCIPSSSAAAASSRCFARRWSNVAHYPGFYNAADSTIGNTNCLGGGGSSGGCTLIGSGTGNGSSAPFGSTQPPLNAYSLFPPRQHLQQQRHSHSGPIIQARSSFAPHAPTHNSYGQHNHLLSTGIYLFHTQVTSMPIQGHFLIYYYFLCTFILLVFALILICG
jgi:hypothetical protein